MSGAVEGPDGVLGDGQGAEPLAGAFPRLRDRSPTSTCHTTAATLRGACQWAKSKGLNLPKPHQREIV
uniref:Uncharacterized protein n=1 Tax=Oryza nivara TaxID=4536 RepID=A0A0E0H7W6_ORYNI